MTPFEQSIRRNWNPIHFTIAIGTSSNCKQCFPGWSDEEIANATEKQIQALDEGGFSWNSCESCQSPLGSNRFSAHAIERHPNNHTYHIEICDDCLCYHANGSIPKEWQI